MERLRQIREQAGYSQQDLADESGVSQHTISEIELGRRKPQGRTLRKLAKVLDVEVRDFYGEPDYLKGEAPPWLEPSFNDVIKERRFSRFADAIAATADRAWSEAMREPETDPKIVAGMVDAILSLHGAVVAPLDDEQTRQALTREEGDEIFALSDKLLAVANVGVRRLEEAAEDESQEEAAKRMRERIREWNRKRSA